MSSNVVRARSAGRSVRFVAVALASLCWNSRQTGFSAPPQDKRASPATPSKEEEAALRTAAAGVRPAMMRLVTSDGSAAGSAFVISKKHRLVATAGHVADVVNGENKGTAWREGTRTSYVIRRVWYHPRVEREHPNGIPALSDNPLDGQIASSRLDVAVLQLTDEGPDLPVEIDPSRVIAPAELAGRTVGYLGYHGDQQSETSNATPPFLARFGVSSVIERDFGSADPAVVSTYNVYTSRPVDSGQSGGAVFLANGCLVGVVSHTWASGAQEGGEFQAIPTLSELIAYHGLEEFFSPAWAHLVRPVDGGKNSRLDDLREAARLTREADGMRRAGDYRSAVELCNRVRRSSPSYAGVFLVRCKVYLYYLAHFWSSLSDAQRKQYARWAYDDAHWCNVVYPESVECTLFFVQSAVYIGCTDGDRDPVRKALNGLESLLDDESDSEPLAGHQLAFAYNLEAQCHQFLGDVERAREAFGRSIEAAPLEARWYLNRAQFWDQCGQADLARSDRRIVEQLREGGPASVSPSRETNGLPALPKPSRSAFDDESS
jgi:tetratricopeptide (TPR) repeat protein